MDAGGIQAPLDHLLTAYQAAGGTADFDPAGDGDLQDLRVLIAPLQLPADIELIWRSFQEHGPPGILDTLSLGTVELAIGAAPHTNLSRALLLIGSGGSSRCYLELDDADLAGGGAVWTLDEFASEIHEVAPSLSRLLDATAIAWERGVVRLSEDHPFPWAAWDEAAWKRLKAEVLPAGRVAGSRPSGWLPRWLSAEGLTEADVVPRGASARIADLLARGDGWEGIETVQGTVSSMVSGTSASGPVISDGSGELVVYVPLDADRFRLLAWGAEAELDVRRFPSGQPVEPPFDAGAFDALALAVRDA